MAEGDRVLRREWQALNICHSVVVVQVAGSFHDTMRAAERDLAPKCERRSGHRALRRGALHAAGSTFVGRVADTAEPVPGPATLVGDSEHDELLATLDVDGSVRKAPDLHAAGAALVWTARLGMDGNQADGVLDLGGELISRSGNPLVVAVDRLRGSRRASP